MRKLLPVLIILILVGLLIIFIKPVGEKGEEERAKEICIEECKKSLAGGQDLSKGPCLLNPISELPDWVCDVAHSPRQDVDNLPENQCSAYRQGLAKHFIEVDTNCKFIKSL
jgi:hypothetical protein